jgi:hypothetical protein
MIKNLGGDSSSFGKMGALFVWHYWKDPDDLLGNARLLPRTRHLQ